MPTPPEYEQAFDAWTSLLGPSGVSRDEEVLQKYSRSTLRKEITRVKGVLFPRCKDDVIALVKIAARHTVPLYPISTGKNWGFGSAVPVEHDGVVVDMSRMRSIIHVDTVLGVATVEPGVTFGQLTYFLKDHAAPFISPVTGAGGNTSVLGNLLEKGRSESGAIDRVATLLSFDVVLANGECVSTHTDVARDSFFAPWGAGPEVKGLFLQSNLGIVVSASITLASLPEYVLGYALFLSNANLIKAIDALRLLFLREGVTSPMRIVNKHRLFTRLSYQSPNVSTGGVPLSQQEEWVILGTITGSKQKVMSEKKILMTYLKALSSQVLFFDETSLRHHEQVVKVFPWYVRIDSHTESLLPILKGVLAAAYGRQHTTPTLPVWKKMKHLTKEEQYTLDQSTYDFDADPLCGFMFFSGQLPMMGGVVEQFLAEAEILSKTYNVELIVGLLTMSARSLKINIPIVFNKQDTHSSSIAAQLYRELCLLVHQRGGFVDRKHIHAMGISDHSDTASASLAQKIKQSLDPKNIISPGRYI